MKSFDKFKIDSFFTFPSHRVSKGLSLTMIFTVCVIGKTQSCVFEHGIAYFVFRYRMVYTQWIR